MLLNQLNKDLLIFDGAFGTQLQEKGMKSGDVFEEINIDNEQMIIDIHLDYLKAGADFITTNTFGANPIKFASKKYRSEDVIKAAVTNAKKARDIYGKGYIAFDIGPIGKLMEPIGSLSFDEVYDSVKSMINLVKDEVDCVLFETMSDLYELKAGILAVKENSDLPIFATMTFESNARTLQGCDPITMINVLEGLKVDALGVNCSLGPIELKDIIDEILANTTLPVMIQPNAGLPCMVKGKTCYEMDAKTFVGAIAGYIDKGVAIVGGCCGSNPEFIKGIKTLNKTKVVKRNVKKRSLVSSGVNTIEIGKRIIVCGERLNPTGKKKLKEAIKNEKYEVLINEAINQVEAKADVLDINVGVPEIDEAAVITKVIKLVQEVVNVPLQIDSSNPQAIEKACRYYNGKPLINSINGKKESMDAILPIVAKYGGMVIGLCLDENGIPDTCEKRVEIAKRIIDEAQKYGIGVEDIVIDCLVLTASAQQDKVIETLKAVKEVKKLGVKTVLGVSNVSFGLPKRPLLNKTFLTMAIALGLDLPIINPLDQEMMAAIDASNVLLNSDLDSKVYIDRHSNSVNEINNTSIDYSLEDIIQKGLRDQVSDKVKTLLKEKEGLGIVSDILIPTLDKVGKDYESGKIYLPQLIQAAEASKIAFELIQATIKSSNSEAGIFVLCTVKGDVHDIGKNIVKVVCQSYGYKVIDLGKDVDAKLVLEAYNEYHPVAIGLSALMTTTVSTMKDTIKLLKDNHIDCPIIVGGAVLNGEVAKDIKADYYANDAMSTVEILKRL